MYGLKVFSFEIDASLFVLFDYIWNSQMKFEDTEIAPASPSNSKLKRKGVILLTDNRQHKYILKQDSSEYRSSGFKCTHLHHSETEVDPLDL